MLEEDYRYTIDKLLLDKDEAAQTVTITAWHNGVELGTINTNDESVRDGVILLHDIVGIPTDTDLMNPPAELADKVQHLSNLALFFQSVDDDNNPYNNIVVTDDMKDKISDVDFSNIDFTTASTQDIIAQLVKVDGITENDGSGDRIAGEIPTVSEALQHVQDMVSKHSDIDSETVFNFDELAQNYNQSEHINLVDNNSTVQDIKIEDLLTMTDNENDLIFIEDKEDATNLSKNENRIKTEDKAQVDSKDEN